MKMQCMKIRTTIPLHHFSYQSFEGGSCILIQHLKYNFKFDTVHVSDQFVWGFIGNKIYGAERTPNLNKLISNWDNHSIIPTPNIRRISLTFREYAKKNPVQLELDMW